jgi:hypothetical protein
MDFREWVHFVLVDCDMCTLCSIIYDSSFFYFFICLAFPINNKCSERIINIECMTVVSFYDYEMNTVIVINFDTAINITPHSCIVIISATTFA